MTILAMDGRAAEAQRVPVDGAAGAYRVEMRAMADFVAERRARLPHHRQSEMAVNPGGVAEQEFACSVAGQWEAQTFLTGSFL